MDVICTKIEGGGFMTKQVEKQIDELYSLLHLKNNEDEEMEKSFEFSGERSQDFFEKRWDSSFFAKTARY